MEKINVAELLRDCPKGMELDCAIYEDVVFHDIVDRHYPIRVRRKQGGLINLNAYGCLDNNKVDSKCVIFPKGKTTWEGFQRPFKDGDIIFTHANSLKVGLGNTWISIFQEKRNGGVATYVDYAEDGNDFYSFNEDKGLLCMDKDIMRQRFATEEEKQKLFKAIKDKGYKWNEETKTLEELIEPNFKVGDRIKHKDNDIYCTLGEYSVGISAYRTNIGLAITYKDLEQWELAPDKFDINTLKPFDKVLVRMDNKHVWEIQFFERLNTILKDSFVCMGRERYHQCIPYEGNEHLLNTAKDCNEYFKTWK